MYFFTYPKYKKKLEFIVSYNCCSLSNFIT
nr:MAG TPA_asm: hypothetical protein [Caudoviricetes sp.]